MPDKSSAHANTHAHALDSGRERPNLMVRALLLLIRGYQIIISPALGPRCRFEPSCSRYAADAIVKFGVLRGSVMAIRRLGSCHPFHSGGYDPVP